MENRIRLGVEDRTIKDCIERSAEREHLELTIIHSSRIKDLQRELINSDNQAAWFSGALVAFFWGALGASGLKDIDNDDNMKPKSKILYFILNSVCVLANFIMGFVNLSKWIQWYHSDPYKIRHVPA